MYSSLSMDPGGPANALGASLGRGLSSLTDSEWSERVFLLLVGGSTTNKPHSSGPPPYGGLGSYLMRPASSLE